MHRTCIPNDMDYPCLMDIPGLLLNQMILGLTKPTLCFFFTRLRSSLLIDRSTKKVQVISWGMFEMASPLGGSSHSAKLSDK